MKKLLFTAALFAILSGFTCAEKHHASPLENTNWHLKSIIQGDVLRNLPADVMITAMFSIKGLTGQGGCNNYHSTYTLQGDQLALGAIAATKMACPANDWEARYFEALQSIRSWKITGNQLTIRGGIVALNFERP